jgi:hypothetical protein
MRFIFSMELLKKLFFGSELIKLREIYYALIFININKVILLFIIVKAYFITTRPTSCKYK